MLKDNNTVYTGSNEAAYTYFIDTFSVKHIDTDQLINSLTEHVLSVPQDAYIMAPFTAGEVSRKLKSLSNSSPGKDKVEYRHLKLLDPKGELLQLIFNRCINEKKVPSVWKHSTTVPIYKKGDSSDPSNFRPIALMSCLYKLLMSLLSARASNFAIQHSIMSDQQKCARPSEGCHEHTFTLQSIISDCKRNQKNCFFAWLDLRNAFGSVSHAAIFTTLRHMGFSDDFISLIRDVYTDATTVVKLSQNVETDPINVHAGVKQGCPISPILFNLSTELLIRTVLSKCTENDAIPFRLYGESVSILAYADDFSNDPPRLVLVITHIQFKVALYPSYSASKVLNTLVSP